MPNKKMDTETDLGEQLARLLWKKQILNREAAALLGVHERTIYKWLSGERAMPPMAMKLLELQLSR
jgi:plasmid maintenance system antidote protein VapI